MVNTHKYHVTPILGQRNRLFSFIFIENVVKTCCTVLLLYTMWMNLDIVLSVGVIYPNSADIFLYKPWRTKVFF